MVTLFIYDKVYICLFTVFIECFRKEGAFVFQVYYDICFR